MTFLSLSYSAASALGNTTGHKRDRHKSEVTTLIRSHSQSSMRIMRVVCDIPDTVTEQINANPRHSPHVHPQLGLGVAVLSSHTKKVKARRGRQKSPQVPGAGRQSPTRAETRERARERQDGRARQIEVRAEPSGRESQKVRPRGRASILRY